MNVRERTLSTLSSFALAATGLGAPVKDIPAQLASYDGSPGNSAKPVKVYILSGQSNMVGMGTLSGAKNSYSGIFYCSDPEIPAGPLDIWQVGGFKTEMGNRAGGQTRGGHVYTDLRGDFKGGKVTIAVTSFLQSFKKNAVIPQSGHLTVWLEEQKLPPLVQ